MRRSDNEVKCMIMYVSRERNIQMFNGTENDQLLDIVIKKDMVQHKLEELNCNKSQGPDEIHPRLLKELNSVIAEPLAKLFQNSLVQGVVPND